jgi:hypothetical protein
MLEENKKWYFKIFIYYSLENSKVDSGHRRTKEPDTNCLVGAQDRQYDQQAYCEKPYRRD